MKLPKPTNLGITFLALVVPSNCHPASYTTKSTVLTDYEYVVVGSGAGGGPLASRLALAGHKTLLIEAGSDQGSNINETVPMYCFASSEDPKMRWDYYVKHYDNATRQALDPKLVKDKGGIWYPRAGTLGG